MRKKVVIGMILLGTILFSYWLIAPSSADNQPINGLNPDLPSENPAISSGISTDSTIELRFDNDPQKTAASELEIDEAVICLDVKDRQPVTQITKFTSDVGTVFCWARVLNGDGKKVKFIWQIGEDTYPSDWIEVKSNKFRIWCPKQINRKMSGNARVDISDETGKILRTVEFEIILRKVSALRTRTG
ncbi:MAG: DUF2914 domain-containing protein [Planctomycetes bacterium]|nr:DUF2914 domain-containing protein [Planctomycetota bacterium]